MSYETMTLPEMQGVLLKARNSLDAAIEDGRRNDTFEVPQEEAQECADEVSKVINAMQQAQQDEAEATVQTATIPVSFAEANCLLRTLAFANSSEDFRADGSDNHMRGWLAQRIRVELANSKEA